MKRFIIPFQQITMKDIDDVGGKNASLGEMIRNLSPLGIAVPDGFAVTVAAFYDFLAFNCASPQLQVTLDRLDHRTLANLSEVGEACRSIIKRGTLPDSVKQAIVDTYNQLQKSRAACRLVQWPAGSSRYLKTG